MDTIYSSLGWQMGLFSEPHRLQVGGVWQERETNGLLIKKESHFQKNQQVTTIALHGRLHFDFLCRLLGRRAWWISEPLNLKKSPKINLRPFKWSKWELLRSRGWGKGRSQFCGAWSFYSMVGRFFKLAHWDFPPLSFACHAYSLGQWL